MSENTKDYQKTERDKLIPDKEKNVRLETNDIQTVTNLQTEINTETHRLRP